MAYITREETKFIRENLKKRFPNIKFSVTMRSHMTLNVVIKESDIDFSSILQGEKYIPINHYHLENYGEHAKLLGEIVDIMKRPSPSRNWYNRSKPEVDYFDHAYFMHLSIGSFDYPYKRKEK